MALCVKVILTCATTLDPIVVSTCASGLGIEHVSRAIVVNVAVRAAHYGPAHGYGVAHTLEQNILRCSATLCVYTVLYVSEACTG